MTRLIIATTLPLAIAMLIAGPTSAQGKKGPSLLGADTMLVYRTTKQGKLRMRIYLPKGHRKTDRRPAIVFFFGGGWRGGNPKQFAQHSRYLAGRGMVAMTAEYRVYKKHKAKVTDCVDDALYAIRWVRKQHAMLGVDPKRIAAAGGSAGGHLAAITGTVGKGDAQSNAMLLFNPALDLRPKAFNIEFKSKRYQELHKRFGAKAEMISPVLNIGKHSPPAIIFHGKDDPTVPIAQAHAFVTGMKKHGHRCELAAYDDQKHGFFNYGRGGNKMFLATLTRADQFLAALGWLEGEPQVIEFLKQD